MKLLILTDHSTHSRHNSVYALARELRSHIEIRELWLATRGDERNNRFFSGSSVDELIACPCPPDFNYPADEVFKHAGQPVSLDQFNCLFLRLPRPVDERFFATLEQQFNPLKIVNRPSAIQEIGSKAFLTQLDRFVVPMKLCETWSDIKAFSSKFDCVLKPLKNYGGKGIIKIAGGIADLETGKLGMDKFEAHYNVLNEPFLAMKFLKNVKNGDKRIVVVDGKVLTASLRYPAKGGWLCNVAQGGYNELAEPEERELEIVEYIQEKIEGKGIFYYGLDTLENDSGQRIISEINTLSIGGIAPAEIQSGKPLSRIFANQFVAYIKRNQ